MLQDSFEELNHMVSGEMLLNDQNRKLLSLYTLMPLINSWVLLSFRIINLFLKSITISNPQHNYTMTENELLWIEEFLNKIRGIIFVYKITVFSYHKNMVYAATLSESQRVIA